MTFIQCVTNNSVFKYIWIFWSEYIRFRRYSTIFGGLNIFVFVFVVFPRAEYIRIFEYFTRIFGYKYFFLNYQIFTNSGGSGTRKSPNIYLIIRYSNIFKYFGPNIFDSEDIQQFLEDRIYSYLYWVIFVIRIYLYSYSVNVGDVEYIRIRIQSPKKYLLHTAFI